MFENNTYTDVIPFLKSLGAETEIVDEITIINKFSSVESELFSLNYGVGLRLMNNLSILEMRGADSLDFLHRISTNTIKNLNKEEIRQTIFVSQKGRILGVASVINFEGYLLLVTNSLNRQKIIGWINKFIIGDDVKISDASHRFDLYEISGPQSDSFMSLLVGNSISDISENYFKVVNIEGILVFLSKFKDVKGDNKFWIIAEPLKGKQLISYMLENKGPFDFNLVGEAANKIYNVEHGIPSEPFELNDLYNPYEAKMTELIDNNKGCYIGQEVITRLNTYDKVQKNLVGLYFSGDVIPSDSFSLLDDQQNEVGSVTSIAYSPRMKRNLALAYVKKAHSAHGTKLTAKNGSRSLDVIVSDLPFSKH